MILIVSLDLMNYKVYCQEKGESYVATILFFFPYEGKKRERERGGGENEKMKK